MTRISVDEIPVLFQQLLFRQWRLR
jgi:hypothetical protein